jgi:pretoxin HINT domain-containing protein
LAASYKKTVSNGQAYFQSPVDMQTTLSNNHHSCFPAGTQILTLLGPRPIEQVKMGDRVLSQEISTGELAFQPIQATTLRSPTPLIKITVHSEPIVATVGHPFWVLGEGWKTASHLKVGDFLRGIDGATVVESLENVAPREVYNLVVSECHNYFVGETRLLVHDNSPLRETGTRVPGLAPDVAAAPNNAQAAVKDVTPPVGSK